jgi:hypothetical protein
MHAEARDFAIFIVVCWPGSLVIISTRPSKSLIKKLQKNEEHHHHHHILDDDFRIWREIRGLEF